jgi:hypothetical protein
MIANKQLERVCAQFSYRDVTVIKGILRGWSASTTTTVNPTGATGATGTTASTTESAELLTPPRTPQYSSNKAARTSFNTTTSAATATAETPAPVTGAPVTDSAGLYEVVFAEPVLGITLVKQGGMPIVEVRLHTACHHSIHRYYITHTAATHCWSSQALYHVMRTLMRNACSEWPLLCKF